MQLHHSPSHVVLPAFRTREYPARGLRVRIDHVLGPAVETREHVATVITGIGGLFAAARRVDRQSAQPLVPAAAFLANEVAVRIGRCVSVLEVTFQTMPALSHVIA